MSDLYKMILKKHFTCHIHLLKQKYKFSTRWTDPLLILRKHSFSTTPIMAEHTQRTASNFRDNVISNASIIETSILSPSVVGLTLKVVDHRLSFSAGQWVDLFIPNINQVGGFSMYSSPSLLKETQQLCLAVKKSSWPPAKWVHSECKVGSQVQIRVGGDFFYGPSEQSKIPNLLFIAGGVGINPLLSIMLELKHSFQIGRNLPPKRMSLFYTARNMEELLFKDKINEIKTVLPESFCCKYFVTRPGTNTESSNGTSFVESRITLAEIKEELDSHADLSKLICFVCGPPPMTDSIRSDLINIGLAPEQIKSEKWW